jgi:hypothetical protein
MDTEMQNMLNSFGIFNEVGEEELGFIYNFIEKFDKKMEQGEGDHTSSSPGEK